MIKQFIAVDTNIIFYALDEDFSSQKKLIALDLIANTPVISSQVVSEIVNILHKRWKYGKLQLVETVNFLPEIVSYYP